MIISISNSTLSARINLKGAELISLQKINSKREYIWEGDPKYWGKHSPILFPIVGTLKNNLYSYRENKFELPRHGFARDLDFILIDKNGNEAIFLLESNEITKKIYPFEFELQIIYSLISNELSITYKVINKGFEIIPYSIGGHPAFKLENTIENYSLQFDTNENLICYQLENDLLSEKTKQIELNNNQLPLNYSLFENDALILKELQSNQIQIIENKFPILSIKFKDFPNFGIWTKMNAPFICLEPWIGYSDTLNTTGNILEKEGIQLLESNSSNEFSFSIEIF